MSNFNAVKELTKAFCEVCQMLPDYISEWDLDDLEYKLHDSKFCVAFIEKYGLIDYDIITIYFSLGKQLKKYYNN